MTYIMKINFTLLLIILITTSCVQSQSDKVLVFSKTEGFRHESIEAGVTALIKLGEENNFKVTATEDANYFNADTLKNYDAVIFLNTTGNIFNKEQEASFKSFIQSGGGFVGIHAATDTEYDWPWYGKFIGAYFDSHPEQQQATIEIVDSNHLATKNIPKKWSHFDEWYNFKNISTNINVLANLDESSYKDGKNGDHHPIAWYQEFDGGKMFYTGLGHTDEAYSDVTFLAHVLGGIQYVLGNTVEE